MITSERREVPRGWLIASLVAFLYLITSLVVVLNSIGNATGVVWLPSFPGWYYALTRALYLPFQPYFFVLRPLQENPAVTYSTYALVSRAPFLVLPLVLFGVTAYKWPRRRGRPSSRGGGGLRFRRGLTVLSLLVAAVLAYAAIPALRTTVNTAVATLDPRDISRLRDYLAALGPWAPAVSFLLMVLQSVAAPLPAFVITLANGLLFGAFWGGLLSWSSAMVGAAVCFGIARALGRPTVERLVGGGALAKADAFFERYGSHAVLISRLIPVISFDVVSYVAGLTTIRFVPFMVATGIGQLPATIVYSILGENLTTASRAGLWAASALLALVVLGLAVRNRLDRQIARRTAASWPTPVPVTQEVPSGGGG